MPSHFCGDILVIGKSYRGRVNGLRDCGPNGPVHVYHNGTLKEVIVNPPTWEELNRQYYQRIWRGKDKP